LVALDLWLYNHAGEGHLKFGEMEKRERREREGERERGREGEREIERESEIVNAACKIRTQCLATWYLT